MLSNPLDRRLPAPGNVSPTLWALISKQHNKHLQTTLTEAVRVAPPWNPQLKLVHERERSRGNASRATLAVARKLVAYLLAVDHSGQVFQPRAIARHEAECQEEQVAMPEQ